MNKIKNIFGKLTVLTIGLLSLPRMALAQAPWEPTIQPEQETLDELIRLGLNTAIIFAAVVAVAFLIFNGFKYMTAAGDTAKTEEAQKGIANALIGLVIALVAAVLVNFVLNLLGMSATTVDQS